MQMELASQQECAVSMADELIKELKSNVDAYAEGRRQTAINESAISNLIAELQKRGGKHGERD